MNGYFVSATPLTVLFDLFEISNTFLFHFSNKMLVNRLEFTNACQSSKQGGSAIFSLSLLHIQLMFKILKHLLNTMIVSHKG